MALKPDKDLHVNYMFTSLKVTKFQAFYGTYGPQHKKKLSKLDPHGLGVHILRLG